MKCTKWVTIDCDGKNAKFTSKPCAVEPWQICFPLELNIPDSYFERPKLSASVSFDEYETVVTEVEAQGVSDAIKEITGLTLQIKCDPPEVLNGEE